MTTPPDPHNAFFKACMGFAQTPIEFCQAYVPSEICQAINFDTLQHQQDSFVDHELRQLHSDLILSVELSERPGYLYFVFEHQSSADKHMVFRMIHYCMQLMSAHQRQYNTNQLPVIYPLLFYHGQPSPYPYPLDWLSAFDDPAGLVPQILSSSLKLVDLQQIPDEELKQYRWLGVMSLMMKHIREADSQQAFMEGCRLLAPLLPSDQVLDYIRKLARYFMTTGEIIEADQIINYIDHSLSAPVQESIMTIADYLREEGLKKGREEGLKQDREEGREEGRAAEREALAVEMLKQGADTAFVMKITKLTPEQIKQLKK